VNWQKKYSDKAISRQSTQETLKEIIINNDILLLIDATHPFATNISKKAINLSKELNLKYIRYERPQKIFKNAIYVNDFNEASHKAIEIMGDKNKNIMYLAGIKNLKTVSDIIGKDRLIARVLPVSVNEALSILPSKNIIGMQGIFSKELNKNIINDYNCGIIITKDSGDEGGLTEKIEGALEANAIPIIIQRPKINYPLKFNNINDLIEYFNNI
jgi:precorrin-6A/cobalt-precorrin-6A reductase